MWGAAAFRCSSRPTRTRRTIRRSCLRPARCSGTCRGSPGSRSATPTTAPTRATTRPISAPPAKRTVSCASSGDEADPRTSGRTTLVVTSDHGRGASERERWRDHGSGRWRNIVVPGLRREGSDAIFVAVRGPARRFNQRLHDGELRHSWPGGGHAAEQPWPARREGQPDTAARRLLRQRNPARRHELTQQAQRERPDRLSSLSRRKALPRAPPREKTRIRTPCIHEFFPRIP